MDYKIIVITKIDLEPNGNLAMPFLYEAESGNPFVDLFIIQKLRMQVFQLGEIIITNLDGREIGGAERKPDKWAIEYKEFSSMEEAIKLSQELTNNK